jgi:hypothetical protein
MKKLFVPLAVLIVFYTAGAQKNSSVVVNPTKQNEDDLTRKMYRYPEFISGKAFNKDSTITEAKFNYNYYTNEVLFIALKGDTLELTNGAEFDKITMGTDTFYYYDKQFVQQVTSQPSFNLFLKRSLKFNGSEKSGPYGTYSGSSSITSVDKIVDNRIGTVSLKIDENLLYVFRDTYFVSDRFGQFYPATKKGFLRLFSKKGKELQEFLEKNEIDFSKREDLEKLLDHMRPLLK